MRFLFYILFLCFPLLAQAQSTDSIFCFVEQMPHFKSDSCEQLCSEEAQQSCAEMALRHFIAKNIGYPPGCGREPNLKISVFLSFVVYPDSSTNDFKIERISPDTGVDYIKEYVLKESLNLQKKWIWIPGEQDGKKVKVKIVVPIIFKLS